MERHTAPAAADVEHTLARLEQQLGGDMGLLVRLRLFKRFVPRIGPIRAAILPVDVEKENVEQVGKIVMMRDVAHRTANAVQARSEEHTAKHQSPIPIASSV